MNRYEFYSNLKAYNDHQNELKHYGIAGQKWGTRRWQFADGRFNEAGKERYFGTNSESSGSEENPKIGSSLKEEKKLAKEAKKLEKDMTFKIDGKDYIDYKKVDDIIESDRFKDTKEKYLQKYGELYDKMNEENRKIFREYFKDRETYGAKSGAMSFLKWSDGDMESLSNHLWQGIYDDGDQGNDNSCAIYMTEKGYSPKQINDQFMKTMEIKDNAKREASKFIDDNPLTSKMSELARDKFNDELEYLYEYGYTQKAFSEGKVPRTGYNPEKQDNYSAIWEASETHGIDRNTLNEANKIINKLSKTCNNKNSKGESGWYYLWDAINDLNLNKKNYKDLSNSDWNAINEKIKDLLNN